MNEEVAILARRTADANAALVRGDVDGYLALTEHGDDYTLMAPFGGEPRHGFDTSSEYKAEMARFYRSGMLEQDVVATYASGDLAVLVTVERIRGSFGGLPEQAWTLRVTQVFRREGTTWLLVHRHADPLAGPMGLQQAAALARGETR